MRVIYLFLLTLSFHGVSIAADTHACDFELVEFAADFSTGRLNGCEQLSERHYLLVTDAENRPINPSPWYAFSVIPKQVNSQGAITLSIKAEQASPRYLPKISTNKQDWQNLPFSIEKGLMTIVVPLDQTQYIAGQEIIDNSFYQQFIQRIDKESAFSTFELGSSAQQRAIKGLIAQQSDNTEWLLIIGRQHPPEVTGALALFAFIEELAKQSAEHTAFFNRFNIMVIPNLNPDGVALGNWRHNAQGLDLNRDWGKFSQLETQLVKRKLDEILIHDQRLVFALDFHSTQQDIFYTMPADHDIAPQTFAQDWLDRVKEQRVSSFTVRPKPGSSPGRGVFKQFIADTFKVHAVTFEIGDNTQRQLIEHIGTTSAQALITQMLATSPQDFVYSPKETPPLEPQ